MTSEALQSSEAKQPSRDESSGEPAQKLVESSVLEERHAEETLPKALIEGGTSSIPESSKGMALSETNTYYCGNKCQRRREDEERTIQGAVQSG